MAIIEGRLPTLLVVCAVVLAGCERPGSPHLATLVSPDGTYEVRLTGRVTRGGLFEHAVRAEVYKGGSLHLPARLIYVAGLFDTPFAGRFGPPDWIGPAALRFPGEGESDGRQPEILNVRNESPQPFRSIRIETAREMFMIFDLQPATDLTVAMMPPRKPTAPNWFDVLVDSGDADTLMRGHGTFQTPRQPRPRAVFTVTVSAHGVKVTMRQKE